MVRLDVSPDVVFTATPSLFNLDGKVDVPGADRGQRGAGERGRRLL